MVVVIGFGVEHATCSAQQTLANQGVAAHEVCSSFVRHAQPSQHAFSCVTGTGSVRTKQMQIVVVQALNLGVHAQGGHDLHKLMDFNGLV